MTSELRPTATAALTSFAVTTKVLSGVGAVSRVGSELDALGAERVAVVADQGVADAGLLDEVLAVVPPGRIATRLCVHPDPDVAAAEELARTARAERCDVVLAVGGGSALGAAKAVAIRLRNERRIDAYEGTNAVDAAPAPTIAVPTTAGSGSEVSKVLVLHEPGRATELVVRVDGGEPRVAILDASVLRRLPRAPLVAAGLDALSHAVEALWARAGSSFGRALAHFAAATILDELPAAAAGATRGANAAGNNDAVLQRLLEAACAANMACGNSGLTLVHALSGAPTVRVPHGLQNGILLPHVARLNYTDSDDATRALINRIDDLYAALGFKARYDSAQLPHRAADAMVAASTDHPFRANNPRPATDAELYDLLAAAGVARS